MVKELSFHENIVHWEKTINSSKVSLDFYSEFLGKNSLYPPEVLGIFQFEPLSLKIGNVPP